MEVTLAQLSLSETEQFLTAGLFALRCMDVANNHQRHFGPDADATWQHFSGLLRAGDRIHLLLSDAAVTWQEGFSLAAARGQYALSADGLIPPDVQSLLRSRGEAIWASALQHPLDVSAPCWRTLCRIWGYQSPPSADIPEIDARSLLLVGDLAALSSLVEIFRRRTDLDWLSQVRFIDSPSVLWRQQCALGSWYAKAARVSAFLGPAALEKFLSEHTNAQILRGAQPRN